MVVNDVRLSPSSSPSVRNNYVRTFLVDDKTHYDNLVSIGMLFWYSLHC